MEIIPNNNDRVEKVNKEAAILSKDQLKKLLEELDIKKEVVAKKIPKPKPNPKKEPPAETGSVTDILRKNFVDEE